MVKFEGDDIGARRFVRNLGRIDGVVNEKVTQLTDNGAAIDFRIGFPKDPIIVSQNRAQMLANSSVSLNESGEVDTFALRYPPLPEKVWQHGGVLHMMRDILSENGYGNMIEVQANPGGTGDVKEWWPHLMFLTFDTVEKEFVLNLIRETFPEYMDRAREETERLRSQVNG